MALNVQGNPSGNLAEVSANVLALRIQERSINVGAFGSFSASATNGTTAMTVGVTANAPVFSFRSATVGGPLFLVRRVRMEATVGTTAFAITGGFFQLFVARTFTGSDTSGLASTLTTNNAKRRTSFATTAAQDFRIATAAALTAGTRTLDATPVASVMIQNPGTAGGQLVPPTDLIRFTGEAWPIVLAVNEGLILQATVPATGNWFFSVSVDWDEVPTTEI